MTDRKGSSDCSLFHLSWLYNALKLWATFCFEHNVFLSPTLLSVVGFHGMFMTENYRSFDHCKHSDHRAVKEIN